MMLRLDEQLCFALYATSRAMTAAYAPLLDELGLTYPQYLAMLVLWERDGQRVSQLGEQLHLDSATLTPLLKRLEARGLIERKRSASDERVVEVFLTADGKRLKRRCADVPLAMFGKSGLTLPELVRLRTTLQELTRRLRSDPAPAASRRTRRTRPARA
jgi:MarR family transcriptional regulator, organic hydroperoxide resistance regulator